MPDFDFIRTPPPPVPVITPVTPPWGWRRGWEGRRIVVLLRDSPKVDPDDPRTIPDRDAWDQIEGAFGVKVASLFAGAVSLSQLLEIDGIAQESRPEGERREPSSRAAPADDGDRRAPSSAAARPASTSRAAAAARRAGAALRGFIFGLAPSDPPPRPLSSIVEVRVPAGGRDLVALLRAIRSLESVEQAYLASRRGAMPGGYGSSGGSLEGDQFYLEAGSGVNAVAAGTARGEGVTVIDVERAWGLPHDDVPEPTVLPGDVIDHWQDHGIAVLGILGARDNQVGTRGIATEARLKAIPSQAPGFGPPNVAVAITMLIAPGKSYSAPGDIILIEEQTNGLLPVEIEPHNRAAIQAATACGRVVIEAAVPGGLCLDKETWLDQRVLKPGADGYADSGAIMVGSAFPQTLVPLISSNYGERLDCFAPGRDIATTAWSNAYMPNFSGTSAAAAIVAGAAAVVQGLAGGRPLTSRQMRWVLTDSASMTRGGSRPIGGLPDLGRIAATRPWAEARANEPA